MKKYDFIVAGGGFAGVAAAITAARAGLRVLLFDRANCLGGAAANCLVNPFMPYWTNVEVNGEKQKQFLSGGLFREILEELYAMGGINEKRTMFHEEYLKLLLNRMAQKAGVDLLFHTVLIGAEKQDGKLISVTVANKSGNLTLEADYFADATGDADLAVLCGEPFRLGRDSDNLCQPMTLNFRLAGVDLEKFKAAKPGINPLYKEFQAQGKIKNVRDDVLVFYFPLDGVLHFNSTRIIRRNPVDAFDVTRAEMEAREQVFELYHFLRDHIDGFQNSEILSTAAQIGVRESRMIDGEYVLTGQDITKCTKFEDSIAVGNYDIDIHNPDGGGTSHYYFPDGEYYTIPYRTLVPRETKNLLVAGRCISADHEAQASIRIMPIVCCLGEAAGTAAGVACKAKTTFAEADVPAIQALLRKQGAIID